VPRFENNPAEPRLQLTAIEQRSLSDNLACMAQNLFSLAAGRHFKSSRLGGFDFA
jgi:hypothetical protein